MSDINSKTDLINLIVDDIWVGDLIYDQYLGVNNLYGALSQKN